MISLKRVSTVNEVAGICGLGIVSCLGNLSAAHAQTLTINTPPTSIYTFELPSTYKPQVGADGKVTLRLKVIEHFNVVPATYSISKDVTSTQNIGKGLSLPDGILGAQLKGNTEGYEIIQNGAKLFYRKPGDMSRGKEIVPGKSPTGYEVLFPLYQAIRNYVKSKDLTKLRDQVIDPSTASFPIKSALGVFNFGDELGNTREARSLALEGTHFIDLSDFGDNLPALKPYLKLLKDPDEIETQDLSDDHKMSIEKSDWQNCGRWFYKFLEVAPKPIGKDSGLKPMKMVDVSVAWVVEATFDPAAKLKFPILDFAYKAPADATSDANAQSQPASDPEKQTAGPAGTLGFTATDIAPLAGLTGAPGFDIMAGIAIMNDGWSRVLGFNAYTPQAKNPDPAGPFFSLKKGFLPVPNPVRLGLLMGLTDSSNNRRQSVILAPSMRLNKSVTLFGGVSLLGGAFSDSNNNTRQSLAFGASINITQSVAPGQTTASKAASKPITISLSNETKVDAGQGSASDQAAIIWIGSDDATKAASGMAPKTADTAVGSTGKPSDAPATSTAPKSNYTVTIIHDDGTTDSDHTFNFAQPSSQGKDKPQTATTEQQSSYWIDYAKPGKIYDVVVTGPNAGSLRNNQYKLTGLGVTDSATNSTVDITEDITKVELTSGKCYRIRIERVTAVPWPSEVQLVALVSAKTALKLAHFDTLTASADTLKLAAEDLQTASTPAAAKVQPTKTTMSAFDDMQLAIKAASGLPSAVALIKSAAADLAAAVPDTPPAGITKIDPAVIVQKSAALDAAFAAVEKEISDTNSYVKFAKGSILDLVGSNKTNTVVLAPVNASILRLEKAAGQTTKLIDDLADIKKTAHDAIETAKPAPVTPPTSAPVTPPTSAPLAH